MTTTVREALQAAKQRLAPTSDSPHLDAEVLLGHVLTRPRSFLHAWPDHRLTDGQEDRLGGLIDRREKGEPIAYLTGEREFWSQSLRVGPGVLIPRPETELLVELALGHLPSEDTARIADLGTGSGAIALALARECPRCRIVATDVSSDALRVARENADRMGIRGIEWRLGTWLQPIADEDFDVIVSNPPYVASDDPHLAMGDVRFEPREALAAGPEGLDDLRTIIREAPSRLRPGGWLILEHGCEQGSPVRDMLAEVGLCENRTHRDLAGLERASLGRRPASDEQRQE